MMLETEFNSGEYKETTSSTWPGDGYVFNSTLSKCKNGSNLSWDNDKKQVMFDGNTKDKCYVYFDVYKEPTVITDVCKGNDNLSNCIKKLYVSQGKNNLYLHDSSLTNGAGDNSYRYAGSSDTTNNFVCFGSNDDTCPTDYLYRIIGVFDNQVKLIKYDYAKSTLLGTNGDYASSYQAWDTSNSYGTNKGENIKSDIGVYYWNNNTSVNTWSESRLNTVNLNTNFLNNIGSIWKNKIANHTWTVGGNTYALAGRVNPSLSYQNEIVSPVTKTTYNEKVGLMYISDYGYAASSNVWNKNVSSYNNEAVTVVNWMYQGLVEWTITPQTDNTNTVFNVSAPGNINYYYVYIQRAVRPSFYLNSSVTYVSGNGTKEEPILIK